MTKKLSSKKGLTEFNKYWYYEKSVQNFKNEVDFLTSSYKDLRKKKAKTLKEDFCGTAGISCEWVKQGSDYKAWGIDLDPEPIAYGKAHHWASIPKKLQGNMQYLQANVLENNTPKVDICFAFNFSYQIFKKRKDLVQYFKKAHDSLDKDGVFFLDMFGGPESQTVMTDIIEHENFKYYWECQKFNPLNNECRFAIHIKRDGEKKRKDVFVYDWRLYSITELKDALEEAGFSKVITYWEGEDGEGGGDGEFYPSEEEENCEAWVTYLAALK